MAKKKHTGRPAASKRSSVVARKDGRELRRMTIYLPIPLARKLAVYSAEQDVDMSSVVADAVDEYLGR